ncbi:MAG: transglycosylase [Azorhizobium sp. 32-67-21]|nr:MAG: transglycosylase [Azorhizobium sp. 32-67-21]
MRCVRAALLVLLVAAVPAAAGDPVRALPAPQIAGAMLEPVAYDAIPGWRADDARAAFTVFLNSCGALEQRPAETGPVSTPQLRAGLEAACRNARALGPVVPDVTVARLFFEANFRPFRIVPERNPPGFLTGYYEPEVEGSATRTAEFGVPVYARPDDLIASRPASDGNRGAVMRREGDALVPYHDRAGIEDGALAGRGLEVAWIAHPVDLFFMQIQGSARIRLTDGRVLRLNYDGHNGYPYTPVGRILIERGLVPREEMSMARIREFIEADPQAGRDLMRQNRSFVFFKAVPLSGDEGALGAEGVPLTAGRSIAVDRHLHTYGSPIFIDARLPLGGPAPQDAFRRLMIAQDTGSAIVGPARADLFFGAGDSAAMVAGRIRHPGAFVLLAPRFAPAP